MSRFLEELSLSALPALETVFLDGWVLRFSAGFTRRANSINPLYPNTRPLEDNLSEAEELYRRRGQRVVFKLTAASLPEGLDAALAERGYDREAPTSVQTLDLRAWPAAALGATIRPTPAPTAEQVRAPARLYDRLTDDWLSAASALNATPEPHRATQRQMLSRLVPPTCFAVLRADGRPLSLGLGVLQSGWLGLYDIITLPEHRRRGHARQLVGDMLGWAAARGAHGAYLQVMQNNAPALALYERLGFTEAYQYWYRVKE